MSGEDGSVTIVFNGEIYNFQELKPKLQSLGHVFKTNSDTETIVHLYESYPDTFVERLRGMFAFALWDDEKSRLFLVRDRLGVKPLLFAVRSQQLAFASTQARPYCIMRLPRRRGRLSSEEGTAR